MLGERFERYADEFAANSVEIQAMQRLQQRASPATSVSCNEHLLQRASPATSGSCNGLQRLIQRLIQRPIRPLMAALPMV